MAVGTFLHLVVPRAAVGLVALPLTSDVAPAKGRIHSPLSRQVSTMWDVGSKWR